MILKTPRCKIHRFSESYIQSALPLFTNEQVRAFLGGPLPLDWAEKRLDRWALGVGRSRQQIFCHNTV